MAIRNIVTRGYGAGATIAFVTTRGYSIGEAIVVNKIFGIVLSMSTNEILLREKHPNIRLKQIASKIVFRE